VQVFTAAYKTLRVRSLSSIYNCVGMVFASRRTVVDVDYLPTILEDDGYRQIPAKEVVEGDVVVYADSWGKFSHVGVVIHHSPDVQSASWKTRVLSQWGADGEFFHDLDDVHPYLGKPKGFWTERSS